MICLLFIIYYLLFIIYFLFFILSNYNMPKFNNGKITSSVIFYDRGVPPHDKNFGFYASLNYSMLRQIVRFNKQNGRPNFTLF